MEAFLSTNDETIVFELASMLSADEREGFLAGVVTATTLLKQKVASVDDFVVGNADPDIYRAKAYFAELVLTARTAHTTRND